MNFIGESGEYKIWSINQQFKLKTKLETSNLSCRFENKFYPSKGKERFIIKKPIYYYRHKYRLRHGTSNGISFRRLNLARCERP